MQPEVPDNGNDLVQLGERIITGVASVSGFVSAGFRFVAWHKGWAQVEFDAGPQHANPMGTLHGGFVCGLADTAMGMCFISTLAPGDSFATLELKINFLRPVKNGKLVAEATCTSRGRNVGMVDVQVVDDQGRLVAKGSSTCYRVPVN